MRRKKKPKNFQEQGQGDEFYNNNRRNKNKFLSYITYIHHVRCCE